MRNFFIKLIDIFFPLQLLTLFWTYREEKQWKSLWNFPELLWMWNIPQIYIKFWSKTDISVSRKKNYTPAPFFLNVIFIGFSEKLILFRNDLLFLSLNSRLGTNQIRSFGLFFGLLGGVRSSVLEGQIPKNQVRFWIYEPLKIVCSEVQIFQGYFYTE